MTLRSLVNAYLRPGRGEPDARAARCAIGAAGALGLLWCGLGPSLAGLGAEQRGAGRLCLFLAAIVLLLVTAQPWRRGGKAAAHRAAEDHWLPVRGMLRLAGSGSAIGLGAALGLLVGALSAKLVAWLAPAWPRLSTVQALPGPLPPLSWPDLSVDTVRSLFGATLVMTLLALTEATAIAKAVARQYHDTLDGNREFIGQGLANLVGSFLSSMPASGSFNRSAVNTEAGARTPLAAISAALFLVIILGGVSPLATHLPLAVVAGLLFVVARGLFDLPEMRRLWRDEPLERVPLLVTLAGTLALSLEWAILLGITSALLVRRAAR